VITFYNVDTNFESFLLDLNRTQLILDQKFQFIQSHISNRYGIRFNFDPTKLFMSKLESHGLYLINHFPDYLSALLEWILLVPLFLYFFFIESYKLKIRFLETIPNPIFEKTYVLFSQFNTKFGEYIISKFIEATFLGFIVTLGLLLIGFPYPFILGLFAGVTNILPYIGPFVGMIPGLLIALLSNDPNVSLLGVIVIFAIANLVDMILIFPLLVSKIVNLHPVLVVVSIIIGSQIAGVLGMVVIIPFIAFFKLLFKEIYKDLTVHL
jgi:putative permease